MCGNNRGTVTKIANMEIEKMNLFVKVFFFFYFQHIFCFNKITQQQDGHIQGFRSGINILAEDYTYC